MWLPQNTFEAASHAYPMNILHLNLRSQSLQREAHGRSEWAVHLTGQDLPAEKACIVVCDMWDQHWSRGAAERCAELALVMNGDSYCRTNLKAFCAVHRLRGANASILLQEIEDTSRFG